MAVSRRDTADYYTLLARKEGYPARSVYKLKEIQDTFSIIKRGDIVLDVGSAPGSWTLFIYRQILKGTGKIVSVDLNKIELTLDSNVITFFQGDAFSEEIMYKLLDLGPYDSIVSDAAPMTTGNRTVDTARSEYLVSNVISLAEKILKKNGNLVLKVFQGSSMKEIQDKMKSVFSKVKQIKPKACRNDSFEIYMVGLNKK